MPAHPEIPAPQRAGTPQLIEPYHGVIGYVHVFIGYVHGFIRATSLTSSRGSSRTPASSAD
eukprot:8508869-Alexandrium_andersonii.AAC.1